MSFNFDLVCDEHATVLATTRTACADSFAALVSACVTSLKSGGKLLIFGNGGSAADAQHIAAELVVRYKDDRPAIAAIALSTDSSILTAGGNDLGFDQIFARQIEALGRPGDVAIGITTSGTSANVVNALKTARSMGLVSTALTGRDGGIVKTLADPCLIVPSATTARIQEMHILLGHVLCEAIEQEICP